MWRFQKVAAYFPKVVQAILEYEATEQQQITDGYGDGGDMVRSWYLPAGRSYEEA